MRAGTEEAGKAGAQKSFGKIPRALDLPDLLAMQKNSFAQFLQLGVPVEKRKLAGLQAAFLDIFPIESSDGSLVLEFVRYELGEGRYNEPQEARYHDSSFSRPLKAVFKLSSRQPSGKLKQIIEQEVVLCEIPMMTESASFIINGAERVVVSQLHRSPGIIFEEDEEKKLSALGKKLFFARVIPYRGAWLEFEFDLNNVLYAKIDRKKKVEATVFLRACGIESDSDILKIFYPYETAELSEASHMALHNRIAVEDVVDQESGEILLEAGKKLTHETIKRLMDKKVAAVKLLQGDPEKDDPAIIETLRKDKIKSVKEAQQDIYKKLRGQEFVVPGQAEAYLDFLFFKNPHRYDLSKVGRRKIASKLHRFFWELAGRRDVAARPEGRKHKYFALPAFSRRTLCLEDVVVTMQHLIALNRGVTHLIDGAPKSISAPVRLTESYDSPADHRASFEGRSVPMEFGEFAILDLQERGADDEGADSKEDLKRDRFSALKWKEAVAEWLEAVPALFNKNFHVAIDDIDHLGNRRVRGVGELLENQIRAALSQMARVIRDRMNPQDRANLTPRMLFNAAPLVAILRKFFGTSQLSQFMDQVNPLAEVTHKRRLSALGPGGLHRKHAGFEVRDVHHTHYGRICPIETPEGPNIGLITSLASYARINEYGLIETPFRKVAGGRLTGDMEYLGADAEGERFIAQANTHVDKGRLASDLVSCRSRGDFPLVDPARVDYMDISPMQVVSVSAALIPFLEHDDANRALMGSNMQRQAVPLLLADAPLVGTGIEGPVAQDSGACVTARRAGRVLYSSGEMIAVAAREDAGGEQESSVDVYTLRKYDRSNQDTCVDQLPLAKGGEAVRQGQVLADGSGTSGGDLALGRNLLVGFLPWEGYNFEDAILVSERLVQDDIFTSIHISEFECQARETKLGPEEITRDIPNVGAEALESLDEAGIVIPSTNVRQGDILVGKVIPKGEQQLSPEERLLKVIFGKKAEDVQDSSLRVPPGVSGKVIAARIFVRREKLDKSEEKRRLDEVTAQADEGLAAIKAYAKSAMEALSEVPAAKRKAEEKHIAEFARMLEKRVREDAARRRESLKRGDELPITVNKVVKIFIASKRKLQVGDKLAGRHGNKGVVSKILPVEDMPFLPDGTPLDVVLSPLGIPSRMNVGQLLETMLGWAAHTLNVRMINPVFDGASEAEILDEVRRAKKFLRDQGVPEKYLPTDDCRTVLYDGRTGEAFHEKASIGYMYVLKLNHLVEDKIHARSTGPYALITRQPLGGKAQFGGQRFGEMEVWAIEGYGAAAALQEFLTVKSDDVIGRTKMYEAIIKGEVPTQPGVPESFKVLVKELQALALNVDLLKESGEEEGAAPERAAAETKAAAKHPAGKVKS